MKYRNCFEPCFIGLLDSCDCKDPSSGIFVNHLPGITFKKFVVSATPEIGKGEQLFQILQNEAIEEVSQIFLSGLTERYDINHTLQTKTLAATATEFSGDVHPRGACFERYHDDRFQELKIHELRFNALEAGNGKLIIEEDHCQLQTSCYEFTCEASN